MFGFLVTWSHIYATVLAMYLVCLLMLYYLGLQYVWGFGDLITYVCYGAGYVLSVLPELAVCLDFLVTWSHIYATVLAMYLVCLLMLYYLGLQYVWIFGDLITYICYGAGYVLSVFTDVILPGLAVCLDFWWPDHIYMLRYWQCT